MAAQTLACSGISAAGSAPFTVSWAGIGSNEFANEAQFRAWAADIFQDDTILRKLMVAWYLSHDPAMNTPALLLNAQAVVDAQGGFSVVVGG